MYWNHCKEEERQGPWHFFLYFLTFRNKFIISHASFLFYFTVKKKYLTKWFFWIYSWHDMGAYCGAMVGLNSMSSLLHGAITGCILSIEVFRKSFVLWDSDDWAIVFFIHFVSDLAPRSTNHFMDSSVELMPWPCLLTLGWNRFNHPEWKNRKA